MAWFGFSVILYATVAGNVIEWWVRARHTSSLETLAMKG